MWQLMKDNGTITRPCFFLWTLVLFMLNEPCLSVGGDTLLMGRSLSLNQTLVSQGNVFELGFFTKGNPLNLYLGIWFREFPEPIIVWVANREQKLSALSSSKLEFSRDGNLVMLTNFSRNPIWSTNFVSPTSNSTEAVLQNNGNFVVRDVTNPSTIYWQSFDHPTDTLLPGAKLGIDKHTGKTQVLTSWKNSEDPALGRFSFGIDPVERNRYFIEWNNSERYWSTGVWNGYSFDNVPKPEINIFNYTFISNENESYVTYSTVNSSSVLIRCLMDMSGQLRILRWFAGNWDWPPFWEQPLQTKVYGFCGTFGISRENVTSYCECLPGFEPFSMEDTKLNDWSGGCVRKTPLQCQNGTYTNGMTDSFLKIPNIALPKNSKVAPDRSIERCKSACMQNCSCTAYAYVSNGCLVWEGALLNLQLLQDGSNSTKQDLYLKLAASGLQKPGGMSSMETLLRIFHGINLSNLCEDGASYRCTL